VALVLGVPSAEILRSAVRHGVFHRDDLEGAWIVENRAGLDDFFPNDPGPWDEVYFEKWEGAGSIRIGKKRVQFEATIDEAVHTMTLAKRDVLSVEATNEVRQEFPEITKPPAGEPLGLGPEFAGDVASGFNDSSLCVKADVVRDQSQRGLSNLDAQRPPTEAYASKRFVSSSASKRPRWT
jgi:hypothetical protein